MKRKKNVQINSVFDRYFKIRYVFKKTIILATKFLPTNVSKPRGHISVGNVFFLFFNYIYLKRFP